MNAVKLTVIILLSAAFANAATYPPVASAWDINLGGDTLEVRDVDGNGLPEIAIGLIRDQGSYVYLLDNNGTLQWRNKISVIWPQNSPNDVMVDDLSGNGTLDIVVGSIVKAKTCYGQLSPYEQPIFALERDPKVENNELKWVHQGYGFSLALYITDLDRDKTKEIISGTREGYVYALNHDGTLRWKYQTEGAVDSVYAADLNGDKIPEILAGSYNSIHVLNSLGNRQWTHTIGTQVTGVYAADINNDGFKEVFATADNGVLYEFTAGGDPLWNTTISALKPAITSIDLDGDGNQELFVSSGQTVYALDKKGKEKWEYDTGYPITDLKTGQLANDTTPSLLILGARKLTNYQINQDYVKDLKAQDSINEAVKLYAKKSYDEARTQAMHAAQLYAQLNDTKASAAAQKLNETSALYITAADYYLQAQNNYTAGQYQTSKEQAAAAEQIYIKLADENLTDQTLRLANKAIDQLEAASLYDQALNYFRAKEYLQGSLYAKKAQNLYITLNDTEKTGKTGKLLNNTEEYPKANKNYDEALRLYQNANYTAAKALADEALKSYALLGDAGMTNTTATLIANTAEKIYLQETKDKADEYYNKAYANYNTSNYHGCADNIQKAADYYQNITDTAGQNKAQKLNQTCNTGIDAQRYYAKANDFYTSSQYEPAIDYASKARQLYRTIENPDGALQASDLILEIQAEQKNITPTQSAQTPQATPPTLIIAAAAALLIIAAIAVFLLINRKKNRKKTDNKEEPQPDYTTLLPPEQPTTAETPVTTHSSLDQLLGTTPPETAQEPEKPSTEPPEIVTAEEKAIADKLDALLSKAGAITGKPKEPTTAPTQEPAPAKETPPEAPLTIELTPEEEKTPEKAEASNKPKPPETPAPPEATSQETVKIAEKIKKELKDINKKLTRE